MTALTTLVYFFSIKQFTIKVKCRKPNICPKWINLNWFFVIIGHKSYPFSAALLEDHSRPVVNDNTNLLLEYNLLLWGLPYFITDTYNFYDTFYKRVPNTAPCHLWYIDTSTLTVSNYTNGVRTYPPLTFMVFFGDEKQKKKHKNPIF